MTTEEASAIKSQIQAEANKALDDNGGSGLVVMATGSGKSKVGIDRIDRALLRFWPSFNTPIFSGILLVVPTVKLRDETWKAEFEKWRMVNAWQFITPICYDSLHTIKGHKDLIILDECHNITELSAASLLNGDITWGNIVAFTATEPKKLVKIDLLKKIGLKLVYELTLDKAVKLGVVAPYEITVITTELDNKEKYVKAGSKAKPFFVTEAAQYQYLTRLFIQAPGKFNILKRLRFIYNLKSKVEATKDIVGHIPSNLKTLIFCGSIAQAEAIWAYTYHSKTNNEDFDLFVNGSINLLSCVNSLNEGVNIPDLDIGLMQQINSSQLNLVQRIGRHIRQREGHRGRIIIICCKGTVDEKWTKSALEGLDQNNIRWVEYSKLRKGEETINF